MHVHYRTRHDQYPKAQRPRPAKLPRSARQAWKYWRQFVALCERAGWNQEDGATAREFARDVAGHVGSEREGLGLLVDSYYRCRFGGEPLPRPRERQLQEFLRRLPRQLIARPAGARRSTR